MEEVSLQAVSAGVTSGKRWEMSCLCRIAREREDNEMHTLNSEVESFKVCVRVRNIDWDIFVESVGF